MRTYVWCVFGMHPTMDNQSEKIVLHLPESRNFPVYLLSWKTDANEWAWLLAHSFTQLKERCYWLSLLILPFIYSVERETLMNELDYSPIHLLSWKRDAIEWAWLLAHSFTQLKEPLFNELGYFPIHLLSWKWDATVWAWFPSLSFTHFKGFNRK